MAAAAAAAAGARPGQHDSATELYGLFARSSVQRLAFDTIAEDILYMELWWTAVNPKSSGVVAQKKIEPSHWQNEVWRTFIADLLLQLCLYGYAIYRLAVVPDTPLAPVGSEHAAPTVEGGYLGKAGEERPPDPEQSGQRVWYPEVANGDCVTVEWCKRLKKWVPTSTAGDTFKAEDGWHMAMFAPPYKVGPDNAPYLASFAAAAYHDVLHLNRLMKNIAHRDSINTIPSIWTTVDKGFGALGSGNSKPMFEPTMHSGMATVPRMMNRDWDTIMGDRVEALEKMHTASRELRAATQGMLEGQYHAGVGGASVRPPKKTRMDHKEYAVTQAYEAREIDYRRGPEDMPNLVDRLVNNILFAWHVPPQVLGKNINSERLASSNELTREALSRYDRFIVSLRGVVSLAIETVSRDISHSRHFYIQLYPCITENTLHNIEAVLKTDVAIDLYACTYRTPKSYFDPVAMKKKQELMIDPKAGDETRDRKPQSDGQKEAKMRSKNEV